MDSLPPRSSRRCVIRIRSSLHLYRRVGVTQVLTVKAASLGTASGVGSADCDRTSKYPGFKFTSKISFWKQHPKPQASLNHISAQKNLESAAQSVKWLIQAGSPRVLSYSQMLCLR
jgi:hypothetical protein